MHGLGAEHAQAVLLEERAPVLLAGAVFLACLAIGDLGGARVEHLRDQLLCGDAHAPLPADRAELTKEVPADPVCGDEIRAPLAVGELRCV